MNFLEFVKKEKIIPVIKLDKVSDTIPLISALVDGGCHIAEITFRTLAGAAAIKIAAETFPDVVVGAGTVLNVTQAKHAVDSGAKFIVSPGFDNETSKYLKDIGIPYIAGAVTPTEIMNVLKNGNNVIKFFPADNFGGLKAIKALSAPFPQVTFIPTGGINIDNITEYLSSPIILAVGGSWMVKENLINNGDFQKISALMKEAKAKISAL